MINKILKATSKEGLLRAVLKKPEKIFVKCYKRLIAFLDFLICAIPIFIAKYLIKINKKRIVFMTNTFNYTCNPKYICEQLLEDNVDCEIIWITDSIKKKKNTFPSDVKLVQIGTLRCFYFVYSAKIWIGNGIDFSNYFDKKRGQIKIQTMHGSLGIKRLDGAVNARNKRGFQGRRVVRRESNRTDLVITNSLFEENVFRTVFWKNTPMKRLGHARTDILLQNDERKTRYIKQRLFEKYHIPEGKKIVLYGPTHRKGLTSADLAVDFDGLIAALKERFGDDYVVLLRLHNRNANKIKIKYNKEHVFDVTSYPDMQELMMITDVAITDYSSWIYDYVVTYKKGFIYATDLDRYNNNTGLYYTLEETPFPVCHNNEELIENVLKFNEEEYAVKVKEFLDDKEAVDDGNSAKRIVAEILELMK